MRLKFALLSVAAIAFLGASNAQAQTAQLSEIRATLPGFATDTYSGALTTMHSYALPPGTWLGKEFRNLSIQFDGFAGTGATYKQNMASVLGVLNWAVTPRVNAFIGLSQSGNINNFTLSQLSLQACRPVVGVAWSIK